MADNTDTHGFESLRMPPRFVDHDRYHEIANEFLEDHSKNFSKGRLASRASLVLAVATAVVSIAMSNPIGVLAGLAIGARGLASGYTFSAGSEYDEGWTLRRFANHYSETAKQNNLLVEALEQQSKALAALNSEVAELRELKASNIDRAGQSRSFSQRVGTAVKPIFGLATPPAAKVQERGQGLGQN